jgi:3-oxoacyl-[acyl-carrier protein] reductase
MGILEGQVALVTGGAKGIGRGIILCLAEEKAKVVIADILEEDGKKTVSEVKSKDGEAEFSKVDITQSESVEKMIADTLRKFGRLDILINNAGIATHPAWCYDMSYDDWHSVIQTHLYGSFYCLKNAAKVMRKQKYGRIVNISSVAAVHGATTQINYAAAKFGIIGITLTAAKELGPFGITVNCIQPGFIRTDMTNILLGDGENKYIEMTPTRSIGEPSDIANAVKFFVNPASSFVTGVVMRIDGGISLPMGELEKTLWPIADCYPQSK